MLKCVLPRYEGVLSGPITTRLWRGKQICADMTIRKDVTKPLTKPMVD